MAEAFSVAVSVNPNNTSVERRRGYSAVTSSKTGARERSGEAETYRVQPSGR